MEPKNILVLKKGKYVKTKTGKEIIKIAKRVFNGIKPYTHKQEIVGSIRRKKPNPVDIDIVVIPKSKKKIINYLNKKGKYLQGGDKKIAFNIKGVKVEIYFTNKKSWGAHLIAYTGPFEYSIGLRVLAKRKGRLLNQYGLFQNQKQIAGHTENSIYKALGKKWKKPELRGK